MLEGLDANQVVVIVNPINQEDIVHLLAQASGQEMCYLAPRDINSAANRLIAHMMAAAGPVVTMPDGQNISVIDSATFPEVPSYIIQTSGGGAVPAFVEAVPTPQQMMSFLRTVAENHSSEEDFHSAAVEVATISGAGWLLVPDDGQIIQNIPYMPQIQPNPFDCIVDLEENDDRLEGPGAWPEHPQARLDLRFYTAAGVPVIMRAVPHLPTQEIMANLLLPVPGEVSFAQLVFELVQACRPEYNMREVVFSRPEDWDLVLVLIRADLRHVLNGPAKLQSRGH